MEDAGGVPNREGFSSSKPFCRFVMNSMVKFCGLVARQTLLRGGEFV